MTSWPIKFSGRLSACACECIREAVSCVEYSARVSLRPSDNISQYFSRLTLRYNDQLSQDPLTFKHKKLSYR